MNIIRSRRFLSSFTQNPAQVSDLAKILVIPITKEKSYIHFKYNADLVNNNSPLVKYENKLSGIAAKGWYKLKDSDKSYNQKIVHYVEKFLENTPWLENSLISIPSKASILRQAFKTDENNKEATPKVTLINADQINKDHKLLHIPVLYPGSILSASTLKAELLSLSQEGQKYHKKQMLLTGLAVPLSLPFVIVPVIPNIPGFYFAYRFYCNFKALLGAEHLEHIAIREDLSFMEDSTIDKAFEGQDKDAEILLDEQIINTLVESLDIEDAKSHLLKALKQERKALTTKESN